MAKVIASRPRRSKVEVEKEFSKITQEAGELQESSNPKAEELSRIHETETRQAVEGITVENVVQKISSLGLEISKALAELSGKLVAEVERLSTIREAVTLETKELERLHKIDVAATALDQLIADYRTQKEKLETEISTQRAVWEEEALQRESAQKELEENLKKQRQREAEEHEYKKALERKKAQDKYEEDVRLLDKKNKEKQEALEKSWQQRESALKEKEAEWARLAKEAEEFPANIKKEADAAAALAAKTTEQRLEQRILLFQKDAETEKRVAELQIKSLQETVSMQAAEIGNLQRQLEEAKKQVQDIAVRAIEGASGAKALAHINQIAMEQAKTRSPQS
jgi:chromosome segregation ATPase